MGQKYQRYDLVKIADDLGSHGRHFPSGKRAIIESSDVEFLDGDEGEGEFQYTVFIEGSGSYAWYCESDLEHLETNRRDLYELWKATKDEGE